MPAAVTAVTAGDIRPRPGRQAVRAFAIALAAALAVTTYAALAARMLDVSALGAMSIFAAATVSSIGGFAFSALCAPLLAQLDMAPVRMVQTMALCSIAIQGWSVWMSRRDIDLTALAPLLAGGLCALPAGVTVLTQLPAGGYAGPVGVLVAGYGLWALLRPPIPRSPRPGWWATALIGATGGITGGLAAFPGAVVAAWCGVREWPKERQRAVTQAYILVMQIALLGVIAAMAPGSALGALPDLAQLAYIPAALVGAACGLRLFRGLTDRQFRHAVNILLIAAGVGLLV
jgi:uncharacterized membrane protein YfcA